LERTTNDCVSLTIDVDFCDFAGGFDVLAVAIPDYFGHQSPDY